MSVTTPSCLAPQRPIDAPVTPLAGRYGRMLPGLPALDCDDEELLALGLAAAAPDDELADGGEAAGWPVLGQLVAHDITADRSPLPARADEARIANFRTRQTYRLNEALEPQSLFPDLLGFRPIEPAKRIDWSFLFDLPGRRPAQRTKRIDGRLPRALVELPAAVTGDVEHESYRSLAGRDLQRGFGLGLPSGEAVARAFGERPLDDDELGLRAAHGWTAETPLWLYVLKEAQALGDGDRLGPVGGRIVAEALIGIIRNDPESYLAVAPEWRPAAPSGDGFGIAALLAA